MTIEKLREDIGDAYNYYSTMASMTDDKVMKAFHQGRADAYLVVLEELQKLEKVSA
jgi:hypothetical protein